MNKKIFFYGLIIAIAVVSAGAVTYSTQPNYIEPQIVQTISVSNLDIPMEKLALNSKYAIVGEVTNIVPVIYTDPESAQKKADNRIEGLVIIDKEILSDVTLKVEEDLFGNYTEKFITIRIQGGETPEQITIHEGYDTFVVGERVILFVGNEEVYNVSADKFSIIGAKQGTIRLVDTVESMNTSVESMNDAVESTNTTTVESKYASENMTETDMKNKIKSLKTKD